MIPTPAEDGEPNALRPGPQAPLADAPGTDAQRPADSPSESPAESLPPVAPSNDDPVAQLRFLHEILRLATTARTWEELLESVVDGTRDALHAGVSSLYLLDRSGLQLTLAATTGENSGSRLALRTATSAVSPPRPTPLMAPVMASISRMPGPPLGPR